MRAATLLAVLCCSGLASAQTLPNIMPARAGMNTPPMAAPGQGTSLPFPSLSPSAGGERGRAEIRLPDPASAREILTTFDPRQVDLQWKDNRWQLLSGGVLIKDFGRRQADGREALRLIRELNLTQRGTVGTPQPVMEYWLAGGQAPRGQAMGLRLSELDLANLRVEQVQEQWCLRDGPRVLFNFSTHRDEAELAHAVLRKYGFTHVGHVGHQPPAMIVFLSKPDATTITPVAAPAVLAPRTSQPGESPTQPAQRGTGPGEPITRLPGGLTPEALPAGRQFGALPPRPDLAALAETVPFDWRQVQVRRDGKGWKLFFGSYALADFGSNEREARLAHSAINYYRFNQQCLVGRPPVFSYFLTNGQGPHGLMFGLNSVPFRPEALVVRRDGQRWVIGDASTMLLDFGEHQEEAQQTLRAIQRHRFDQLCRVGQSTMTFFVRTR